ncbi:MAG: hypothetical protein D6766_14770 [Verrucomicrobia bacterium]|nr:MAG: hypothetical protein D6766_14770 [Verrucomicrobiota bacterium]
MAELDRIQELLRRAGRRRRWHRAWRGLWHGLLAGGALWLLVLGAYKLFPLPMVPTLTWGGFAAALLPWVGFLAGWLRPEDPLLTARWLDLKKGLKERLSTAVELSAKDREHPWGRLVIQDAARALDELDLRALLPFHLPQVWRAVLVVLALGAGLGFVPEYRSEEYLAKQREKAAVKEAGERLAAIARRTLDRQPPKLETTRESLQSIEELGRQLARRPLDRDAALEQLAKLTDKVDSRLQELQRQPAVRSLQQAARSGSSSDPSQADALQKQIAALEQQMKGRSSDPQELDRLAKALERAKQAASELARNPSAGQQARDQLAQSLADLARQAAAMGADPAALETALEALKSGQIDQLLKNLDAATQDLEQLLNTAKALQQLKAQAAKLGKNLREQLERGQATAAAARLREMARQLQSAQLTPEQMQKLMQELSEALDPAGQYGSVKAKLSEALGRMQKGDRSQAAQALQEAAKELEELAAQAADCQSLQAALKALQKAQMCVGNCNGWGITPSNRGGFSKKGKVGRGVGTWADESLQFDTPPDTGQWDNSGVQRPDMDPKGLTDRGEGEARDDLLPSRVQGQFNPGGPMPSITLRGVSIRGESKVSLQQAMAAAQSEAAAALSEDVIPRPYQGAVKDYFDDFALQPAEPAGTGSPQP